MFFSCHYECKADRQLWIQVTRTEPPDKVIKPVFFTTTSTREIDTTVVERTDKEASRETDLEFAGHQVGSTISQATVEVSELLVLVIVKLVPPVRAEI